MNVELFRPTPVLGLFASSDAARGNSRPRPARTWARQVWARPDERLRYRRALRELNQLDDRELDDLDLARADLPALASRHATGLERLAQT
jgi:uncharacterized protein YjiS (DUF1127 family)